MRGHTDLRRAVTAAACSGLLALILPFAFLRLLVAAPLLLFLPGYAIVAAAFARQRLDPVRLSVLSVGSSLGVLALGSLLLELVPGDIRAGWWALLLFVVTLAGCRRAALRRSRPQREPPPRRSWTPERAELALFGAGGLAALTALILAFTPMAAPDAAGYTAVWMQPPAGVEAREVEVGISNHEQESSEYTIELRTSGVEKPFGVRSLTLDPGKETTLKAPLPPAKTREQVKVTATLFKAGLSAPYRRVSAWVPGVVESR